MAASAVPEVRREERNDKSPGETEWAAVVIVLGVESGERGGENEKEREQVRPEGTKRVPRESVAKPGTPLTSATNDG